MEKLEYNISEALHTEHLIRCSKCKYADHIGLCDEYEAINLFIDDGWYATTKNVYCPRCNDKRKKNGK